MNENEAGLTVVMSCGPDRKVESVTYTAEYDVEGPEGTVTKTVTRRIM